MMVSLERVNRQRSKYHGGNEGECAIEGGGMQPSARTPGQGTRVKVQAGFRRKSAHGRSPTPHPRQWNTVCGWMQDGRGNSDMNALTDSDCSQKFSNADSGENFIRSNWT
jgi:hypothetical protein